MDNKGFYTVEAAMFSGIAIVFSFVFGYLILTGVYSSGYEGFLNYTDMTKLYGGVLSEDSRVNKSWREGKMAEGISKFTLKSTHLILNRQYANDMEKHKLEFGLIKNQIVRDILLKLSRKKDGGR